ncbi:helix-turn-helix domain-containing protein [Rhizobium leucaenae]|uniref:DNA-binding protein Fis n=1 Tax=Rhizobium leucaenae TaxID=29450 RepID=A0A7W7A000_9HYPH|nr:helix-turn-helix domain-containing protein [Rhizobium leucaenae]MBB4571751.1 DNA-binding protein Fis [Rhizobium leucaenae]MBB6305635.1 DNA-binding protein Fis [Rhizobium leucaenae]
MIKHPSFPRNSDFSAAHDVQAQARLNLLFEELQRLFPGASYIDSGLPFALVGGDEPHIVIHNTSGDATGRVTIDAENGLYVFCELDRNAGIVLATASEERLIDEIVAHLSGSDENLAPHTVNTAVGVLVGQTMEDVERKLILQTVRHCNGNPTYAAFMLGIPLITLCTKLATYFADPAEHFADAVGHAEPVKKDPQ